MEVLQEIIVPQESVNDQSLIVLELFFENGVKVKKGDLIAELETSKTTLTVESDYDGYIVYFCKRGDDVIVNTVLARITANPPHLASSPLLPTTEKAIVQQPELLNTIKAEETIFSKEALALITKETIDKKLFAGRDFVGTAEVNEMMYGIKPVPQKKTASQGIAEVRATIINEPDKVTLQKISSNKRREIEYLSSVQSAGLVSTINVVIDTEGVTDHLNKHLRYFKNSLLPVVVYECSRLLTQYKEFNAYFNDNHIAYYNQVNIGFAVDMEKGLKVLKIPITNLKTIHQIEDNIFQASNNYLDDKIKTDDLTDITFTITDLSGEGVASFIPLINMKNSAILGISAIDEKLQRSVISLAFDHRVTEGKAAALFLSELKTRIQSYRSAGNDSLLNAEKVAAITCHKCFKKLSEDLSDVGFTKCITPQGKDAYICQSCFKGF